MPVCGVPAAAEVHLLASVLATLAFRASDTDVRGR